MARFKVIEGRLNDTFKEPIKVQEEHAAFGSLDAAFGFLQGMAYCMDANLEHEAWWKFYAVWYHKDSKHVIAVVDENNIVVKPVRD